MSEIYEASLELREPLLAIVQQLETLNSILSEMPTRRELFAAMAMKWSDPISTRMNAELAVGQADALIAALNQERKTP